MLQIWEGTQLPRDASGQIVEGERQVSQISATAELRWDVPIQLIVAQPEVSQTKEVPQLRWDRTVERVASQIERAEKGQIAERRRNGTAQIHANEVEGGHSVQMTAAAGNAGPVAEGVGRIPICHGMMRIAGNEILECYQGLLIIVK